MVINVHVHNNTLCDFHNIIWHKASSFLKNIACLPYNSTFRDDSL